MGGELLLRNSAQHGWRVEHFRTSKVRMRIETKLPDCKVKIPILTCEDYTELYTSLTGSITPSGTLKDS